MSDVMTDATVGDIVAADFRTAAVFEQFGIDFCCGGRRALVDACRAAAADPDAVVRELQALPPVDERADDPARWPVDQLIDHIEQTHHAYVRTALPWIAKLLAKLEEVHGARHAELRLVLAAFRRMADDLTQHMVKEERVLFPYVRDLAAHADELCGGLVSPFGSVENPIRMMEREHRDAGDEMQTIRTLTNDYTPPADGCTTYAVCMAELRGFDRDLRRHVHLENNILFPRAIALEHGS